MPKQLIKAIKGNNNKASPAQTPKATKKSSNNPNSFVDSSDSEYTAESDDDFIEYDDPEEEVQAPQLITERNWKVIKKAPEQKWLKPYQLEPGSKNHTLSSANSPEDFFFLIFTEDLFNDLRKWTNQRATNNICNATREKNKSRKWRNMEKKEFKAFIGCLAAMGLSKKPQLRTYWSSENLFGNQGIQEVFSYQRFQDIYSNFCLRNPNVPEGSNKLAKISPFVTSIISASQSHYLPRRELTIDESMIPFSGRHHLVQYMPLKPVKYGFKAFLLCEASTGYVLNWKLYTGEPRDVEYGATYRIITTLCDGIEGEGHCLYTDRYYTGLQASADLKSLDIGYCGTVQLNRLSLDQGLKNQIESLRDREKLYVRGPENLLLTCWRDSKIVSVLSNFHGTQDVKVQRRLRKKDNNANRSEFTEKTTIPKSIVDYNQHMGGVDLFDQKATYYMIDMRSKRWYMRILFHFIEIAFVNSYIIYQDVCKQESQKEMSQLDFRQTVVKELVRDFRVSGGLSTVEKTKKRKAEEPLAHVLLSLCKLEKIPQIGDRLSKKKYCQIHKTDLGGVKGCPQTSFWCSFCQVPVCAQKCYEKHKTQTRLKKVKITSE